MKVRGWTERQRCCRRNGPSECCHVCVSFSGCCPSAVTAVALGVSGRGQSSGRHKNKPSGDEVSCERWSDVRLGSAVWSISGWTVWPEPALALCGEREEGGWQPLLAQGESVTFDLPVEVSLPSSQLCLPPALLLLLLPSVSTQHTTHRQRSVFSLHLPSLSINALLASSDFSCASSWCCSSSSVNVLWFEFDLSPLYFFFFGRSELLVSDTAAPGSVSRWSYLLSVLGGAVGLIRAWQQFVHLFLHLFPYWSPWIIFYGLFWSLVFISTNQVNNKNHITPPLMHIFMFLHYCTSTYDVKIGD